MSKKDIERAERAEKDRADSAKRLKDKAERTESDRKFQEVLGGASKPKGCCEPCNYRVITTNGEYKPCKMGHEDSGPDKEICADSSDSHYRPKK